jgi:peptidoglycan/xylan/chitin deacetylase (PgdA/CDA1 family)
MFDPHPRRVAITFDDGYIGQYEHGFRLLAERGMRGTFFVTTDWVGRPGFISWDGLREMARAGMSIQSHTVSHPFLSTLGPTQLRDELTRSRRVLDEQLGQETMSLALPGGDFPRQRLVRAVSEAGYRVVATSRPGVNEYEPMNGEPRFIDRLTVRAGQPFTRFTQQVQMDTTLLARSWAKYQALDLARSVLGRERYHHWRQRVELSFPVIVRRLGA